MIPITVVRVPREAERLVLQVVRSGQLAQGPLVAQFEAEFAARHGVAHAVAVNSGTAALVAALSALGIGPGDEVITSPFTFVATLNAILAVGATARFADIDDDFNVRPDSIEALMNSRTSAIMPVHLYGYPCEMAAIAAIAERAGVPIIEDAAQAVGAEVDGGKVGRYGLGCFSLYATKNLATGEGGVITTDDEGLAERLRLLRNQGMRARYEYEIVGHNHRMTDLAAAIGLPQLRRLDRMTARRRANAAALTRGLGDIEALVTPPPPAPGRSHVYHQYTVRLGEAASMDRDSAVTAIANAGVGCGIYYPKVVYDYDCYKEDRRVVADEVPAAFRAADEVFSLPVHPFLETGQVRTIIEVVSEVFGP